MIRHLVTALDPVGRAQAGKKQMPLSLNVKIPSSMEVTVLGAVNRLLGTNRQGFIAGIMKMMTERKRQDRAG